MSTFSDVIPHVQAGGLAARSGWNGKGMFIFMRPGDTVDAEMASMFRSLPPVLKDKFAQMKPKKPIVFTPYLCMYAADGSIVNGWLASQTDMLADDWQLM